MDEQVKTDSKAEKKSKKKITSKPSKKVASSNQKINELNKQIEELSAELGALKDKHLRSIAEFDNYKKRKEREIENIIKSANEEFCVELLPIIDDFERSLNSESKKLNLKSFKEGVSLIYQKLLNGLSKMGVAPIDAIGEQFNPEFHEAILQIEDNDKPSNTIVNEAVKGYTLKDKVIRYSKVVVSK